MTHRLGLGGVFALVTLLAWPALAAEESCGDLLIVLDRSGSMAKCTIDGKSKEQIAKDAISAVLTKYATIPTGLWVFPNTVGSCSAGTACSAGKEVVALAADGSSKVATYLKSMPTSCGGTPTGVTMQAVKGYNAFTPGRTHFVLLLTDGVPTCDDGETQTDGGVKACNGGGCEECKNPTKVYDAIKALRDRGIHTFVIGFDADKAECTPSPPTCQNGAPSAPTTLNAATLNRMAEEGGEAQDGTKKYFSANDPASLSDALTRILGKVKGGTIGGCTSGGSGGSGGSGADGGGGSGAGGGAGQGDGGGGNETGGGGGCGCAVDQRAPMSPALGLFAAALIVVSVKRRRRHR